MPSETISVGYVTAGQERASVAFNAQTATARNAGPDTVYYGDRNVTSTLNSGSIASGSTATVPQGSFFVTASASARARVVLDWAGSPAFNPGTDSTPSAVNVTVLKEAVRSIDDYGAPTDGTSDATSAIQAAVNSYQDGGPVYIPPRTYKVTGRIAMKSLTGIIGAAADMGVGTTRGTVLDARTITNLAGQAVLDWSAASAPNPRIEHLHLRLAPANTASDSERQGALGVSIPACIGGTVRDVLVTGGSNAFYVEAGRLITFDGVNTRSQRNHGVILWNDAYDITFLNCLFQTVAETVAPGAGTSPANVLLKTNIGTGMQYAPRAIKFFNCVWDETGPSPSGNSCLRIDHGYDIEVSGRGFVYIAPNGYGVRLGADTQRVKLSGMNIGPYVADGSHIPTNTILIASGAQDIVLEDIVTNANGGGDISDAGTNTVYRNVNGETSLRTKAGAVVAADFAGLPSGKPAGPILDTTNNRLYVLAPDGSVKYASLT